MNKKLTYVDGQMWHDGELIAAHSDEYIDIDTEKISELLELATSAVATSYDNRLSGLIADNVQDAIDEVHEELEDRAGINYSTEEKIVGKWIDGSDLFQKVFIIENPIVGEWTVYQINDSMHIVKANAVVNGIYQGHYYCYPNKNERMGTDLGISDTSISYKITADITVNELLIILEYTK